MATHYYEAFGETKAKILAYAKTAEAEKRKCRKLCREVGGVKCGFQDRWTTVSLCGFTFREPPPATLWRKLKDSEFYAPRRTSPAGKALCLRMEALRPFSGAEVAKIIGMSLFSGTAVRRPGVQRIGDRVFVMVPPDVKPKGCRRVSDVTFEALLTTKGRK